MMIHTESKGIAKESYNQSGRIAMSVIAFTHGYPMHGHKCYRGEGMPVMDMLGDELDSRKANQYGYIVRGE